MSIIEVLIPTGTVVVLLGIIWKNLDRRISKIEQTTDGIRESMITPAVCALREEHMASLVNRIEKKIDRLTNGGVMSELTERVVRLEQKCNK